MKKLIIKLFNFISPKVGDSKFIKLIKIYGILGLFSIASIVQISFILTLDKILKSCGVSNGISLIIIMISCLAIIGYILNELLSD